jgi:protoporphyrinogen oxidase
MSKLIILGAGLAGISTSFHNGHQSCSIVEKNHYAGGHIHTEYLDGFTWDEGPHISFTKYEYVKDLFAKNVDNEFLEYAVATGNYFQGHWIPHPAQSNLYAVPEPLRGECLSDFLATRQTGEQATPSDYEQWLRQAFGGKFADTFPAAYTRKYWTTDAADLSVDWVGERVFFPRVEDVTEGAKGPLPEQTHYIKSIRYPTRGGYMAYARKLVEGAEVLYNHELTRISFEDRRLHFSNERSMEYSQLVNTLPLPVLIQRSDAPWEVQEAASRLSCSSLLLVNVTADHPTSRKENWIYVYDEDKYSTRINCTELLSSNNAPAGKTGIQVEVYFSKYKPIDASYEHIAAKVCEELVEMGVVKSRGAIESVHTRWVPWANVIFDHGRRQALDTVLSWLEMHGLVREDDDLEPMTNWDDKLRSVEPRLDQNLFLAGRYAQWKYYWTDDCVLQGQYIAKRLADGAPQ